ncbi:MAG: FAD-binding oxidoreductase [Pseudomonadota bacterium]
MADIIDTMKDIVGPAQVLTGADTKPYRTDWTQNYPSDPDAVLRPGSTKEVSDILRAAHAAGVPVVPAAGRTGLTGGTQANGQILLSLERMNRIREIRPDARVASVEAGVILQSMHEAAEAHDLVFPLTFGAKGSAMIGGVLATNAGGSNVVRYGNTRGLCLGLEVVLADGRVMDLMSELHKDNSGYPLKDLFIGAEGTLGIITAAVIKLFPKPAAYATAMVALNSLPDALTLLNRLQTETGGAVEAFEFMPGRFMDKHREMFPAAHPPFDTTHEINVMVEIAATAPADATPDADGRVPIVALFEDVLSGCLEEGLVRDAVVAKNEAQRRGMWERREQAAELTFDRLPMINHDVSVPLDKVDAFLRRMDQELLTLDQGADSFYCAHLGDGNIHYTVYPNSQDPAVHDAIVERVEDVVLDLRGSFSAEHGIGLSKKASMLRRKDPVALDVMRAVKAALDPANILNPGKVLPD